MALCGSGISVLPLLGVVLWSMVWSSSAHLCLLTPRQRGDLDISEGGSHTCFRHGAECGGEPAQVPPGIILEGGKPVFIKWQQNYNHYSIGFPGYMDLAIAENISTAEGYTLGPFSTLIVVPDPNEYDQAHQRNYTAVVTLPNKDCEHCVIRARYAAHKPGETTFYQCADVKIKATGEIHSKIKLGKLQLFSPDFTSVGGAASLGEERLRRALVLIGSSPSTSVQSGTALYGMANTPDEPASSSYMSVDVATGEKRIIGKLDFRVDSSFYPHKLVNHANIALPDVAFVPDGVLSTDTTRGVTVMPLNSLGKRESFPMEMVEIQTATGKTLRQYRIENLNKTLFTSAFSAVFVDRGNSSVTFSIEPANQEGKYDFVVGRLYGTGVWQMLMKFNKSEDLYINFQWAEYDVNTQTLYVLLGNENDADNLTARIYKFSLLQGYYGSKMSYVELDVSEYTFMSFHVNMQNSNHVWAISPGLHNAKYPAYHLVDINTDVGSVSEVAQLTPSGIFERYYGGSVVAAGPGETKHQMYQVLRVADTQADVILTVDTLQVRSSFSQLTNLRDLRNMVRA